MDDFIDIVLFWVDGNDKEWLDEKSHYHNNKEGLNVSLYRDWDNLHYLFRAFEEFTPWVRKIHFVTWGHLPSWLNVGHPKLNIVNHKDYIDEKYLPVFSSHPLEINIHKLSGLAEKFILFNDDTFIINQLSSERFFKNGLPCDMLISNALSSSSLGSIILNDIEILNKHFLKKESIRKNIFKWFNYRYKKDLMRNVSLLPWSRFTGFVDPHMPQPFLKSTFKEVWSKESESLGQTLSSKFRECTNVNQYIFRYWQLVKGDFYPVSMRDTKYFTISMENINNGKIFDAIATQKYKMVCLNDSEDIETIKDFEEAKQTIQESFEKILPNKSSFEL